MSSYQTAELIKTLPKYEQRIAAMGVAHAAHGNKRVLEGGVRSARTAKIAQIYSQLLKLV